MIRRHPSFVLRRQRLDVGGCRRELLVALLGICRNLERMEVAAEARQACRQVGGRLARWLGCARQNASADGR